jgi:hypothetical protein
LLTEDAWPFFYNFVEASGYENSAVLEGSANCE